MHRILFLFLFLPLVSQYSFAQDTLSFGGVDLPGATVRAKYATVSPLAHTFTIEEVRRLPATFFDPARLIALLPGTVQTNDQANHLSVRGNSPNANLWRLNGLAIVNPNHTSNAGTFYDLPTLNGGGVNALSAQVLDNSAFITGGLPVEYGYATGGTFDLALRPGSKTKFKPQFQVGLIGLDAAIEGPIGKGERTSYLINGRYSFTGLLADAGVDFGGEEIRFGDVNLHLHHQLNDGEISIFGLWGKSTNDFSPDPEEEIEEQKELFEINYDNETYIGGGNINLQTGAGELSGGIAYSTTDPTRSQSFSDRAAGRAGSAIGAAFQTRVSSYLKVSRSIGPRFLLRAGGEYLRDDFGTGFAFINPDDQLISTFGGAIVTSIAPHLGARYIVGNSDIDFGLRATAYSASELTDEWTIEPRLRFRHRWSEQRLIATLERTSQIPYVGITLQEVDFATGFVPVTDQASLAYGRSLGGISFLATAYYQSTPEDYAALDGDFLVSANNFLEFDPSFRLTERTATRRYGIELEAAGGKRDEGWYYRANTSIFRAETEQANGEWAKDRYSNDFTAKLTVGREWPGLDKKQRERTYGLNLALIAQGGQRRGLITSEFSERVNPYFAAQDLSRGFIESNGTYFRPDLRLYKTKVRTKTNTTLAIDLQNVAGISNTATVYYDVFLEGPNQRSGLGLIPVLSYRIEWR